MTAEKGGYLGNPLLKKVGEPIEWTQDLMKEYLKCSHDPIYFAENYIKIVHVDKGAIPIRLRSYQKDIITKISNNRKVVVNSSRQSGKCVNKNNSVKVRNKKTGQIEIMNVGELYDIHKRQKMVLEKSNI